MNKIFFKVQQKSLEEPFKASSHVCDVDMLMNVKNKGSITLHVVIETVFFLVLFNWTIVCLLSLMWLIWADLSSVIVLQIEITTQRPFLRGCGLDLVPNKLYSGLFEVVMSSNLHPTQLWGDFYKLEVNGSCSILVSFGLFFLCVKTTLMTH